jgi:hypothetical protein
MKRDESASWTAAEIVPFGKYKGQPVETLAADRDYCDWLTAQPWFSERYRNVYNVVVNYGAEPQDSPEHNQMQARFLDDAWCFALADLLHTDRTYSAAAAQAVLDAAPIYQKFRQCCSEPKLTPAKIHSRDFEHHGWDVVYGIAPARITTTRISLVPPLPACTCQCDHTDCREDASCRNGKAWCRHSRCTDKRSVDKYDHCIQSCYWHDGGELTADEREWLKQPTHCYADGFYGLILVELKPDLGDDFPSVLRQVKGYPHDHGDKTRCVVVRRYSFQHVTWEDVHRIFAASNIHLINESQVAPA